MKRDLCKTNIQSSFLSCEKDFETIIYKLFIESQPYSNDLKKLLLINTKDCLDNETNKDYKEKLKMSVSEMKDAGYIRLTPKILLPEHEEIKSYISMSIDNFRPNRTNPQFRDCLIHFDVLSHTDYWDIGDYRLRPLKIIGYIDGILNNCKLSGIGTLNFVGCNELLLDENLSGYTVSYYATHGSDDIIKGE